jgi:hypothetical protein
MPGAGRNPLPPCSEKNTGKEPEVQPIIRHSLRDGFNAYAVLLGPGFVAPIAARIGSAQLGLSVGRPGPHDFASASAPFVRTNDRARRQSVHRIPASRVVTIAIRPSCIEAG